MNDFINLMEWNRFAEERKTLLEALTILNNRHREAVGGLERERDEAREQIQMMLKHDAERLESDSIVGSCDCNVKTNEVKYHKPGCKYRLISERDEAREQLATMREAIAVAHDSLNVSTTFGTTPKQDQARAKLQPYLP